MQQKHHNHQRRLSHHASILVDRRHSNADQDHGHAKDEAWTSNSAAAAASNFACPTPASSTPDHTNQNDAFSLSLHVTCPARHVPIHAEPCSAHRLKLGKQPVNLAGRLSSIVVRRLRTSHPCPMFKHPPALGRQPSGSLTLFRPTTNGADDCERSRRTDL